MATATTAVNRKEPRKERSQVREYTFVWEGLDRANRQVRGDPMTGPPHRAAGAATCVTGP